MAVAGALEFPPALSHVGAGDNTAHLPFIPHGQLPGDLAAPVQLRQIKGLLIAADLQDGIRGGIDNHMARGNLFLRQFLQNDGAAGTLIADDLVAGAPLQLCHQFRRKPVVREGNERLLSL